MALFKNNRVKTKLAVGIGCLFAAVFVFLVYVPPRSDTTLFYGLDLIVVWYPLTAILYGAAVMLACRKDYAYAVLMGVVFLTVTVLNTVIHDFAELPAAFVYTGMALASALLTLLVVLLCRSIIRSWRLYKEKRLM